MTEQVAEKKGIQNLKEVLDFGFGLGGAVKNSLKDGSFGVSDVQYLMPVFPTFGPMIDNINEVPKEIADIDDEELKVLVEYSLTNFAHIIEKEKVIEQVKCALAFGLAGLKLFKSFK